MDEVAVSGAEPIQNINIKGSAAKRDDILTKEPTQNNFMVKEPESRLSRMEQWQLDHPKKRSLKRQLLLSQTSDESSVIRIKKQH